MEKKSAAAFTDLLRKAGLRRTHVRVGVLRILSAATKPLAAPSILKQFTDPADKVTVYRTLNTLTGKKLLHRVHGEDRSWLYAIGTSGTKSTHTHPHFVCDDCGTMECLNPSNAATKALKSIAVKSDYTVAYPEVTLHGKCPNCQ